MAVPANQLDAMGLSQADPSDEVLSGGSFARRLALQNAVKTTNQPGLPANQDVFFATANGTQTRSARCHMPINLIHCTATISGAGAAGVDLVLAGDTYIFMKENKDWIQQNLTWSQGQTKDTRDLNLGSRPDGYSVNKYFRFIPKTVRNSIEHQT